MSKSFKREKSDHRAPREAKKDRSNDKLHNLLNSIQDPEDAENADDELTEFYKRKE